jgi:hypothetical protein
MTTQLHRSALLLLPSLACCTPMPRDKVDMGPLYQDGVLAARYEHAAYDPARPRATCKVYHMLYAPDGRLLTKGDGGQFEHHRGLFFGFNQTRAGGATWDFWHCNHGETQQHVGFVAGERLGLGADWSCSEIEWRDPKGAVVVRELRGLHIETMPGGAWRFDFVSQLSSTDAVELMGDPQHSGCQFRALDLFAQPDGPKVRYLRPDSAQAHGDDVWTGCEWIAAVLPLPDGPATVIRIEMPGNPGPVRWSTRDYGRFGATFQAKVLPTAPVRLHVVYVTALGALTPAECKSRVEEARRDRRI